MSLKFCPNCKSIMTPVKEGGKTVLKCPKCGTVVDATGVKLVTKTVIERKPTEAPVVLVEKHETLPKTKAHCPKCGNDEAYYWIQQTRAADEPPTRFYRCTRCGYTWREYE